MIFFGVLATLPVTIVLDLVARRAPRRRRRRRRWLHPIRAVRAAIAPLGRFRELVGNARQQNLLHVRYRSAAALDSPDLARRLRLVLERSGGMFVKFGQIAATRTDLLPSTITDELSRLHADVERVPRDELRAVLEKELGEPVEGAFHARDGLSAIGAPEEILRRELVRALPALRTLPEHAETLAGQLRTGRLVVRSERYAGGDRRIVDGWIDRVLVAAAGGIGALTSATVLLAGSGTTDKDVRTALWILGFSGLTAATVLILRTVAQSLHGQSVRGDWPTDGPGSARPDL